MLTHSLERDQRAATTRPDIRGVAITIPRLIAGVADSISRWAWVHEYESAERHYWPAKDNPNG